jgi:tetratricopeptide (TPR) repeat protein
VPSIAAEGDRLLRVFHDDGLLAAAEWARAVELFARAAELDRGNPEWAAKRAFAEAGVLGSGGGDVADRVARLSIAAELRPSWSAPAYALCQAWADDGKADEALAACAKAAKMEPGWALPAVTTGYVLRTKGDLAGALEAYGRAAALDPASAWARYQQCYVLVRLRKYAEAEARCSEAVRLDPGLWGAYLSLAIALHHEGKAAEAGIASKRAVLSNPYSMEAMRDACFSTIELGDYHDAILLCRRGLELAAERSGGEPEGGAGGDEAGGAGHPASEGDDPALLEALGDAHYALGDSVDALHAYLRALEGDPGGTSIDVAHVKGRIARLKAEWVP